MSIGIQYRVPGIPDYGLSGIPQEWAKAGDAGDDPGFWGEAVRGGRDE